MSTKEDIDRIKKQEKALRFASFNEADAWKLGCQMRDAAATRNLALVIDIRVSGRKMFFTALPGTSPENEDWVQRKINVVMRLHKSSYRVGRELLLNNKQLDESQGVLPIDYAAHGGCFPIHIIGVGVVGSVTVSGIPQRDDHGFVVEQLCVFLGKDAGALALGPEK